MDKYVQVANCPYCGAKLSIPPFARGYFFCQSCRTNIPLGSSPLQVDEQFQQYPNQSTAQAKRSSTSQLLHYAGGAIVLGLVASVLGFLIGWLTGLISSYAPSSVESGLCIAALLGFPFGIAALIAVILIPFAAIKDIARGGKSSVSRDPEIRIKRSTAITVAIILALLLPHWSSIRSILGSWGVAPQPQETTQPSTAPAISAPTRGSRRVDKCYARGWDTGRAARESLGPSAESLLDGQPMAEALLSGAVNAGCGEVGSPDFACFKSGFRDGYRGYPRSLWCDNE